MAPKGKATGLKKTTITAAAAKDNQVTTESNTPAGELMNAATDEPTRASQSFNQSIQDSIPMESSSNDSITGK
jgi:hypothetical protein